MGVLIGKGDAGEQCRAGETYSRGGNVQIWRCRGADVQRCRWYRGAEEMQRFRFLRFG